MGVPCSMTTIWRPRDVCARVYSWGGRGFLFDEVMKGIMIGWFTLQSRLAHKLSCLNRPGSARESERSQRTTSLTGDRQW